MKQRIISATIRLTLLLAAVACRVDKGNENVDTTASGYMLFKNANDAVHEFSQAIDRLQGLDLYIAAADDATREAIRNRFFYDKRIVADAEHEGRWHILSNTTSMTVDWVTRAPHGATHTPIPTMRAASARRCAGQPKTGIRSACRLRPTPRPKSSMP